MNRLYESIKKRHGIEYIYKGLGQLSVFIGPKNDRSKVKQENVMRLLVALDQNEEDDLQLYREDRKRLVLMLTEGMKREYLQKRTAAVESYRAASEEEIRRLQEEEIIRVSKIPSEKDVIDKIDLALSLHQKRAKEVEIGN